MAKPKRDCLPSPDREAFIEAMQQTGATTITIGCLNRYIDEFLLFCKEELGHDSPSRLKRDSIERFGKHISSQRVMNSSAKSKVSAVLRWLAWLHENGRIKVNPAADLRVDDLIDKKRVFKRPKPRWDML